MSAVYSTSNILDRVQLSLAGRRGDEHARDCSLCGVDRDDLSRSRDPEE